MAQWTDVQYQEVKEGLSYNFLRDGGVRYRTMAVVKKVGDTALVLSMVTFSKSGVQKLGAPQLVDRDSIQSIQTVGKSAGGMGGRWKPRAASLTQLKAAVDRALEDDSEESATA